MSLPTDSRPEQTQSDAWTRALLDHPYQRYCGLELMTQSPGLCRCRLQVGERVDNLSHTLHGGVLYSMMDVVSMLACIPLLDEGEYALTSSFNCVLLSPASADAWVTIEANVIRNGRNLLFTRCDAWKEQGGERRDIASAHLSKFRLAARNGMA